MGSVRITHPGSAPIRQGDRRLRALAVVLGVTLLGDGFGTLLGRLPPALADLAPADGLATGSAVVLVASVVLVQLGYAAVGIVAMRRWFGGLSISIPSRAEAAWIGVATLGAIAVAYLTLTGVELLGVEPAAQEVESVRSPAAILALGLVSVFLIGPAEELLYRGAVQGRLRRTFGAAGSIGAASVLFAVVHVTTMHGSPAGTVATLTALFLLSVVYGLAYERTGNLAVPMLVHGLYDAIIFAIAYAAMV